MGNLLCLEDIELIYQTLNDETTALKDLSFCLNEDEFLSIVGPSGCGKTTILSLISGLIKPTSGKIVIDSQTLIYENGHEISETAASNGNTDSKRCKQCSHYDKKAPRKQTCLKNQKNSHIGYMLQRDQLFEWRTIKQNVELGLEIQHKKTPENIAYINALLTKYGLSDFCNFYPRQLSGGMRQRVALIRTLATNPQILLLDEPFSALDFQTRLSVCDDVHKIIKNEKKSAVLVTHDISDNIY